MKSMNKDKENMIDFNKWISINPNLGFLTEQKEENLVLVFKIKLS